MKPAVAFSTGYYEIKNLVLEDLPLLLNEAIHLNSSVNSLFHILWSRDPLSLVRHFGTAEGHVISKGGAKFIH